MATFITSKTVGETFFPSVTTSTGYWKYNHDGTDSSVINTSGWITPITNSNGEFTIISCLSDGTPSGDITQLYLSSNDITSFDGTGLSGLTNLDLSYNQITSFNATDCTSLTSLSLQNNQLTSFDASSLTLLTELFLGYNQLTSFDGTGLSSLTNLSLTYNQLTNLILDNSQLTSLTYLYLGGNQLTSFSGSGLSSLTNLFLGGNQLTSFDGTGLSSLTNLTLNNNQLTSVSNLPSTLTNLSLESNQLTSFDGAGLTSLINLNVFSNQLTSFDGTDLTGLTHLSLTNNLLTSFDGEGLSSLTVLYLGGNQLTSVSNLPSSLTVLYLNTNQLTSFNGADLTSLVYLNLENNLLTSFDVTDLTSLIDLVLSLNQLTSLDVNDLISLKTLSVSDNLLTDSDNDSLLSQLSTNNVIDGTFNTTGFRTSAGTTDYNTLISRGWSITNAGLPVTFNTVTLGDTNIVNFVGEKGGAGYTLYYRRFGVLLNNANVEDVDSNITLVTTTPILNLIGNNINDTEYYDIGGGSYNYDVNEVEFIVNGTGGIPPSMNSMFAYISENFTGSEEIKLAYIDSNNNYKIVSSESFTWNDVKYVATTTTTTTTVAPSNPTFITSKSVGETMNINVETSTTYWKYNHNGTDSSVFSDGSQSATVANANGEFTIISCLADGTPSGNITYLGLNNNQLTSFDGTGLTSLTSLGLENNQLTSFDGTDLTSLTTLNLSNNQLTSFNGTGLTSLTSLILVNNLLTSIDVSPMVNLINLFLADVYGLNGNPMTATANNAILAAFVSHIGNTGSEKKYISTTGGRTSAGTADYNTLINDGYDLIGFELSTPPTFITSKAVGETITIYVQASTPMTQGSNYWKYNHNGVDSAVFPNGDQTITVANANGEFTLIPCLSDGTPSGNITNLNLTGDKESSNQITSFDGTGLTSLINLGLGNNLLTSFDGTGLTSLTDLELGVNQLTSFDGTGLTSLTNLYLGANQLTSFDGTGLTSLTQLNLINNQITSFDGTDLTSLIGLRLINNDLTSLDVSPMVSLEGLYLVDPYGLNGNPMTAAANDTIMSQFVTNGLTNGTFSTANGRTSDGTADYNTLIANGWNLVGLELITPPSGNGKLRIKGVNSGGGTTTTTTTEAPTTTTTTEAPPSYMFSIPQPPEGQAWLTKFSSSNITTTSGYWKFERTNDNGVYTSSVFANVGGPSSAGMVALEMVNMGYGNFTIISCDVDGNPSGTITNMNLNNLMINSFNGSHPNLSGLTTLTMVNNSITSLDVSSLINLETLFIAGPYGGDTEDAMTPQSNTDILLQLNSNGLQNGTFTTNGGRVTSQASESAYLSLINKGWTLLGLTAV